MGYLWIAGAVVVVVAVVLLVVRHVREDSFLVPTLTGAIGAFMLVAGWSFVADPGAPKSGAFKTGGLAGGALVALYALWLRSRVADERFARSVELLGHEAEQVVHGGAWSTDATSDGRLYLHHVVFHGKAWSSRFTCHDTADYTGTRFLGPDKVAGVEFTGPVSSTGCEFAQPIDFGNARFAARVKIDLAERAVARTHAMYVSPGHENVLPDGWVVERREGGLGLVGS
ncbi:hypothetical protein ACRAKI_35160 [Saccharothrix isguenensis]